MIEKIKTWILIQKIKRFLRKNKGKMYLDYLFCIRQTEIIVYMQFNKDEDDSYKRWFSVSGTSYDENLNYRDYWYLLKDLEKWQK